jgi:hypothetical protein
VAARRLGREVAVANETCAVQVYGRGDAVVSIRRIAEPGRAAGGRPAGRPPRAAGRGWLWLPPILPRRIVDHRSHTLIELHADMTDVSQQSYSPGPRQYQNRFWTYALNRLFSA